MERPGRAVANGAAKKGEAEGDNKEGSEVRGLAGVLLLLAVVPAFGQAKPMLSTVRKVFIDPDIAGSNAELFKIVKEKLTFGFFTYANVSVVAIRDQADAVLTGVAHEQKMEQFTVIGGVSRGGDYSVFTLVLRLIDAQDNTVWVFNSDAAKCRLEDGVSLCAVKEFVKAAKKKATK